LFFVFNFLLGFVIFRPYSETEIGGGGFEKEWKKKIDHHKSSLFFLFVPLVRYPIRPYTPEGMVPYLQEIRPYLTYSRWARIGLWCTIVMGIGVWQQQLHIQAYTLEKKSLEEVGWSIEIKFPYSQSEIETFNNQFDETKAIYDKILALEIKAAELGWEIHHSPPFNQTILADFEEQYTRSKKLKPHVLELESKLGIEITYPYNEDIDFLYLSLETSYIPAGEYLISEGKLVSLPYPLDVMSSEVSQILYQSVSAGVNPSANVCMRCPVERVNWLEAVEFANRLSSANGLPECYTITTDLVELDILTKMTTNIVHLNTLTCLGWRLPTELEWEIVSHGDSDIENQENTSAPIQSKEPNKYGIYDLDGNVAEWVWDKYEPTLQGLITGTETPQKLPFTSTLNSLMERQETVVLDEKSKAERVFRGGSFNKVGDWSFRRGELWNNSGDGLGFRLVKLHQSSLLDLEVNGSTTSSEYINLVGYILRGHFNSFKECYDQAQGKDPSFNGEFILYFDIERNGSIAEVFVESNISVPPVGFEMCLTSEVRGLTFPTTESNDLKRIAFPLVFNGSK
jgi:hypothetical protein